MKITDIKTTLLSFPIPEEKRWRTDLGVATKSDNCLIHIETDNETNNEDGTEAHYGSIQPLRSNNFWIEFAKARIEYFEKIKRDPRKGKVAFKCGTPLMEQRFFAGWIN